MSKSRICLVEPCHSHEEVLFPLIDLLRDDYDVYVLAPRSLLEVDLLSRTRHLYNAIPFEWHQEAGWPRRLLGLPGKYRLMRRVVKTINPEFTIFNSTHNLAELVLITEIFKGFRKGQVIHNFQQYLKPGMKWLYDRFDCSLVISEDVHAYIERNHPSFHGLDFFLPISFEGFTGLFAKEQDEQPDTKNVLHLGVIGSVDNRRRNYDGLLGSLTGWAENGGSPKFNVHLVGKAPASYRAAIEGADLAGWVQYYDHFVSFEKMIRVLRRLDIVMFLIDSSVPNLELYDRYKVSCTAIWVKAFRKACAASRDYRLDEILRDKCFFYDGSRVEQIFEAIEDGSLNRALLKDVEARYVANESLSRGEQKKRLIRALKAAVSRAPGHA